MLLLWWPWIHLYRAGHQGRGQPPTECALEVINVILGWLVAAIVAFVSAAVIAVILKFISSWQDLYFGIGFIGHHASCQITSTGEESKEEIQTSFSVYWLVNR
ncbi:MAG: hypothetical protein IPL08_00145 [Saprospiraceae bacterium]|nr:hypothetical protein [Saprospiraceae bacterium]